MIAGLLKFTPLPRLLYDTFGHAALHLSIDHGSAQGNELQRQKELDPFKMAGNIRYGVAPWEALIGKRGRRVWGTGRTIIVAPCSRRLFSSKSVGAQLAPRWVWIAITLIIIVVFVDALYFPPLDHGSTFRRG